MSEPPEPPPPMLPRAEIEAAIRFLTRLLDEETIPYEPPPPGSTRDKLPDEILALLAPRIYLSTACEMALACEMAAKVRHPERERDLRYWAWWLHVKKCRLNNKYSNRPCSCACHDTTKEGP